MPIVKNHPIFHLLLSQISNIDKWHPHGIETEDEDVTSQGKRRAWRQRQGVKAKNVSLRNASFVSLGPACENLGKRIDDL